MPLPFDAPIVPMLAKSARKVPTGDYLYEPKWDGFRALVFRDGNDVFIQSRDKKPLLRYFPELYAPLTTNMPDSYVLDGELVIVGEQGLDFGSLQMRLHPAKSRIDLLAEQTPARFVAFDLLAVDGGDLRETVFCERRAALQQAMAHATKPLHITPATKSPETARDWFNRFEGSGFDGVIAKPIQDIYAPGKRTMTKVKHERTIDCAVAGFRWYKDAPGELVGSLILALFDDEGRMHQIGVAASFTKKMRAQLVDELAELRDDIGEHPWKEWAEHDHSRRPDVGSRWSAGRSLAWEPLRLERVAEVKTTHFDGGRLRHPAHFKRWRLDKQPRDCTFEQIVSKPPVELAQVFG